jgi:hypothetical protein
MKVRYETRSKRARRQRWLKAGIWVFLCIFVLSSVGMVMAFVVGGSGH